MENKEDKYRKKIISKLLHSFDLEGGCWIWNRSTDTSGYGNTWAFDRCWKVNRLSYYLFVGEIPKGLLVCHTCDKPPCFNPDHLWVGTQQENIDDMIFQIEHYQPNVVISTLSKKGMEALVHFLNSWKPKK